MGRRSWTVSSLRHGPLFSADTQSELPRWRSLPRHSHYARSGCGAHYPGGSSTTCRAVFTVLPHLVLRYRQMRPRARDAL